MPACTPSFSSNEVQPPEGCEEACEGKSFGVSSMSTAVLPDGSCRFDYVVKETSGGSTTAHSGSATVACGSSSAVVYYCDGAEQCPRFEIVFTCAEA